MITLGYEESGAFLTKVIDLLASGEEVFVPCPTCGKALVLAVTRERAASLGVPAGIYCPVSKNHVRCTLTLLSDKDEPNEDWLVPDNRRPK